MTLSELKIQAKKDKWDFFQIKEAILHDISDHEYQDIPGLNVHQKTWNVWEEIKAEKHNSSRKEKIGQLIAWVLIAAIVIGFFATVIFMSNKHFLHFIK